jgi:hypothetical protein
LHYISEEGRSFLGVVDARFLLGDVQLEDSMHESFYLRKDTFCLVLAADDANKEV